MDHTHSFKIINKLIYDKGFDIKIHQSHQMKKYLDILTTYFVNNSKSDIPTKFITFLTERKLQVDIIYDHLIGFIDYYLDDYYARLYIIFMNEITNNIISHSLINMKININIIKSYIIFMYNTGIVDDSLMFEINKYNLITDEFKFKRK